MSENISRLKILPNTSIKEALKKIDQSGLAILFVCDDKGVLMGSLTDGDIRRHILKTGDFSAKITNCFNPNPTFVIDGNYTTEDVKQLMLKRIIEAVPILDKNNKVVDILFWPDVFDGKVCVYNKINVPVVIMAGGKGDRLSPFTKIFPKSLIPIGDKPIIEIIIDKFRAHDVKTFYITLNYKGEMIKNYIESIDKNYTINYVWEKDFLGTAGSLKLIESHLCETFIVSNSDIIVNLDYSDLVNFHQTSNNILTVVGSIQHHKIPYGSIILGKDGKMKDIREKPEFDITINTGVYVLAKEAIGFIPKDKPFDMTDLIHVLLSKKKKLGAYPVSQKSYIDIGEWEEYKKALDRFQLLK